MNMMRADAGPVTYNLRLMWRNALLVVPWTSFLYIGYQLTNRYPLSTPHTLPLLQFERDIPFLVWTVVPYFLLIGGMYLPVLLQSRARLIEAMTALTITVLINYSIFILFPTVMDRPPVPVGDSFAEVLYRWLIGIDTPANCFPSGHISVPAIGCWYLMQERSPVRGRWITAVYVVLALSVLTTKQHYAIDIPGGLATAAIGIFFGRRLARRLGLAERFA
jgi:hypothetical protein